MKKTIVVTVLAAVCIAAAVPAMAKVTGQLRAEVVSMVTKWCLAKMPKHRDAKGWSKAELAKECSCLAREISGQLDNNDFFNMEYATRAEARQVDKIIDGKLDRAWDKCGWVDR
jgi:hypothetical protein